MSGGRRSSERVIRDDRLLDAAGAGAGALEQLVRSGGATRDPLLALLAQWHDEVADGTDLVLRPAVPPAEVTDSPPAGAVAGRRHNGAHPTAGPDPAGALPAAPDTPTTHTSTGDVPTGVAARHVVGATRPPTPGPDATRPGGSGGPVSRRSVGRRRRVSRLGVAVSVAVLAAVGLGGVALGAGDAGPGSPLWPVTQAFYPDRAASKMHQAAAQRDLDDAQHAAAAGDTADARRYLDDAGAHLAHVRPSAEATRLRQRAERMRRKLDAAGTGEGNALTTPTPSATAGNGKGTGNGKGNGKKATPTPNGSAAGTNQGNQYGPDASPSLDAASATPEPSESPSPTPKPKKSKKK